MIPSNVLAVATSLSLLHDFLDDVAARDISMTSDFCMYFGLVVKLGVFFSCNMIIRAKKKGIPKNKINERSIKVIR